MILHITTRLQWRAAQRAGAYRAASLGQEGFIHCSTPQQVLRVANACFAGQKDLLLICIDPARLDARVVYEDSEGTGETFPHVYGPINLEAVTAVVAFPPCADGSFTLPQALKNLLNSR